MGDQRLSEYPYVRVRIACEACQRRGSYRLARLAAKYGPEILLDTLIELLSADCALRRIGRTRGGHDMHCKARFPDLHPPQPPPDLPPGLLKLRVIGGGRS